ncbi:myb-like protein D [Mercenaria mercenaria]|uniref:myb-like protein D n=1 Tax=Mercenaria mercenaria TaxID=6596 RepID=UPI00234E8E63|nr:myb-like protein D [Mercenaria mercenaria]
MSIYALTFQTQAGSYCCGRKKRGEEINQNQMCPATVENFNLNTISQAYDPYQSSRNENNASKSLVRNKNIHPKISKEEDLVAQLEEMRATVERVHSKNKKLWDENKKLKETISTYMENNVEKNTKGRCDIVNDPRSLKHIASKFDDIYCTEWEQAFDLLESIPVDEIEILVCLKEILESCYVICFSFKRRNKSYQGVKITQAEKQGNNQQLFSESILQSLLDICKSMRGHGLKWLQSHIELQINDRHPKCVTETSCINSVGAARNDQPSPSGNDSKKEKKNGEKENSTKKESDQEISLAKESSISNTMGCINSIGAARNDHLSPSGTESKTKKNTDKDTKINSRTTESDEDISLVTSKSNCQESSISNEMGCINSRGAARNDQPSPSSNDSKKEKRNREKEISIKNKSDQEISSAQESSISNRMGRINSIGAARNDHLSPSGAESKAKKNNNNETKNNSRKTDSKRNKSLVTSKSNCQESSISNEMGCINSSGAARNDQPSPSGSGSKKEKKNMAKENSIKKESDQEISLAQDCSISNKISSINSIGADRNDHLSPSGGESKANKNNNKDTKNNSRKTESKKNKSLVTSKSNCQESSISNEMGCINSSGAARNDQPSPSGNDSKKEKKNMAKENSIKKESDQEISLAQDCSISNKMGSINSIRVARNDQLSPSGAKSKTNRNKNKDTKNNSRKTESKKDKSLVKSKSNCQESSISNEMGCINSSGAARNDQSSPSGIDSKKDKKNMAKENSIKKESDQEISLAQDCSISNKMGSINPLGAARNDHLSPSGAESTTKKNIIKDTKNNSRKTESKKNKSLVTSKSNCQESSISNEMGYINSRGAAQNDQPFSSITESKNKTKMKNKTKEKKESSTEKESDQDISLATTKFSCQENSIVTAGNAEKRRNIKLSIHRLIERMPDILQNSILKAYINACLKSCLEAVSCEPQLKLKFSLQNRSYAEVKSMYRYKQYIFDSSFSNKNVKDDESILVVWPAVSCEDQSGNESVIETENAWVIVNNI